jgi:hypothetical protein
MDERRESRGSQGQRQTKEHADLWSFCNAQIDVGGLNENARDRNRLCIEVSS